MTGRLGLHQNPRHLADALRVGRRANARRRLIGERGRQLFIEDIFRDLDQHRSRATILDLGEGAPQRVRHRRGKGHLLGGLGDVLEVEVGVEVGWNRGHRPRIASRQHDDRHGIAVGLGNAAEGVLRPRAELHGEDADPVAGGDAADRVGHVQPGPLLTDDDGPDVGRRGRFDNRVDRVSDQVVDPLPLEDLGHGRSDHHHDCCSFVILPLSRLAAGESARPGSTLGFP